MDRREELSNINELPHCVLSYIFSKLSVKDLFKTRILSKKWLKEWRSRMDLNFDLCNMFEGCQHNDIIDGWISQAVANGAERIELLLANALGCAFIPLPGKKPYEFPFSSLLSRSDSIKYLHLQNCLLIPPVEFHGFKKLTTLVLDQLVVEQALLLCLFSNCFHLKNLTFHECSSNSDLNIVSPALHHLSIINREIGLHRWMVDIVTSNLSYFECCGANCISFIKAPQLFKLRLESCPIPLVEFSGWKKLRTLVLRRVDLEQDLLLSLFSECFHLEDLTFMGCLLKSDLTIVCPTLRHLCITIFIQSYFLPRQFKIDIDTLNLSSFEYDADISLSSIKAPEL